jgi:hypothetical protein
MTRKIKKNKFKNTNINRKTLKGAAPSAMLKIVNDTIIQAMREEVFEKYGNEEIFKDLAKTLAKTKLKEILIKYDIPGRSTKNREKLIELILDPNAEIYKKHEKSIVDKKSGIEKRLSTLQYEAIKDYIYKYYEINQPPFTIIDQKKKEEIWNCSGGKSCFSLTGNCKINAGDHIYGIRENINRGGKIGSDSLWNIIPCTQKENVSWKLNYNGKNLVYDFESITDDDIDKFTDAQKVNYENFKKWKIYCDQKGADLFWINGREINKAVTDIVTPLLNEMDQQIQELDMIPQDKILSIITPSDDLIPDINNYDVDDDF